jgi:hypothetical protein
MNQLESNIKPTNSYPFVPGQYMLCFDSEGNPVINDPDNSDLLTDISYQTVAKLSDSICSNNLEKFKQLYTEEYINRPDCCDFFKFEDIPPYWEYSTYSLCSCENKEAEPDRIHKYMYIRPCHCQAGKRYLAYLAAFNAENESIFYDTHPIYARVKTLSTPIQQFLLDDGPIDLTYRAMFYTL